MASPTLFRVLVLLLMAAHVFAMYGVGRTFGQEFGAGPGTILLAAGFSFILLAPLVWAVTLPELPEIYTTHYRARRRWRRGECAACGYDLVGAGRSERCSECGSPVQPPRGYSVSARTVRRFVILVLAAWLAGCLAAESWLRFDESSFLREAKQHLHRGAPRYDRPARWPNHGVFIWERGAEIRREEAPRG